MNREVLEIEWKQNEAVLANLYSAIPGEPLLGRSIDQIEAEQDLIEFMLGLANRQYGSRKWSGMP
jgi:hypothetical protein